MKLKRLLKKEDDIKNSKIYENSFEWRFEFPNLLDEEGNFTGFDIVIGNPPYVQLQRDGGKLGKLYSDLGYKTYARTGDIYALFYEKGIDLLKDGGVETLITSNSWMRAGYGKSLRNYFLDYNPIKLIDLGGGVFESATVNTNILIVKKQDNQGRLQGYTMTKKTKDFSNIEPVPVKPGRNDIWTILSLVEQSIKEKIKRIGIPLKEWSININYGIKTGYNKAFIISSEKRNEILSNCANNYEKERTEKLIRPILRGRDIKKYTYNFADLWLINTHNGLKAEDLEPININDYPAVKGHLDEHWENLEKRYDQGDTPYNLRNCAYIKEFDKEKIAWASVGGTFYSFIDKGYFLLDTNYFFTSEKDIDYLIGVLNSKLVTFWINSEDTKISDSGAYRHYKYNLERLNIPLNNTRQTNKIKEHIIKKEYREIDKIVFSLYELTQEEIDYIESVVE